MADQKETLKKKISDLKGQLTKQKEAGKDLKVDKDCRQLRKTLKRAQRRLKLLTPRTLEEKGTRLDQLLEMVTTQMSAMTKDSKKASDNPHVHSLRKKVKSINKLKKANDRRIKKRDEKSKPAAAPPAAAAPAAAAPAAPAPAAPAAEGEKK